MQIQLLPDWETLPILAVDKSIPPEPLQGFDNIEDKREAEHYRVYSSRWYILFIFAVVGVWQNLVYSTFGPIAESATASLKLTQTDLALLPNWYNIVFVFTAFPYVYLVEIKGLRMPMTATMGFCSIGAAVRCLHTGNTDFDKIFLHLGQLINGFGAAVPFFACTTISAVWFPPGQRNLATAIGLFASNLGIAIAFFMGPAFVNAFKGSGTDEEVYRAIYKLFYFEAIVSNALLFITVFYFPSRPPSPPSFSASAKRVSYKNGFREFAMNPRAWLIFTVYSLNTIFTAWTQFLGVVLQGVMSEAEIGYLGAVMITVPILVAPLVAAALATPRLSQKSRQISIGFVLAGIIPIAVFTVFRNIDSLHKYLTPVNNPTFIFELFFFYRFVL